MSSPKGRVNILVPTFQPNDAVGNDAAGMYHFLKASGYDTHVYAEHIHAALSTITEPAELRNDVAWSDPDAVLIYHHAIDWELGEKILAKTKNKIVIKYHNVTPADFFANYCDFYYWACVRGREATARLSRIPGAWIWGDSQYNADECIEFGADPKRCRVVAPIHRIEDLARQPFDNVVNGVFRDTCNVLFVGGMRPNKGHTKALETMVALRDRVTLPVRMLLVGNFDANLARYTDDLNEYMRHLNISDEVFFAHSVTPGQLRSYYMVSRAFLCVSEHEGFCVPLVEAMAFRVPVVAWATTAVGETAGGCGLIHERFEPEEMANSLAEVFENPELSSELAHRGRRRYEEVFHIHAIEKKLLTLLEEVMAK